MQPTLHWIASYPKSGNTWARLFLANYLRDDPNDVININDISAGPHGLQCCSPPAYIQACGFIPKTEEAQFLTRPLVQNVFNKLGGNTPIKTHSANMEFEGIRFIDPKYTKSATYIIRNPCNIIPSYADHFSTSHEEAFESLSQEGRSIVSPGGIHTMLSSWDRHVNSWKNCAEVIRYEDLPDAFPRLLYTMGIPPNGSLDKAIEDCSIKKLKLQEVTMGFEEQRGDEPFFSGVRCPISDDLRMRVIDRFYDTMKEFDYV